MESEAPFKFKGNYYNAHIFYFQKAYYYNLRKVGNLCIYLIGLFYFLKEIGLLEVRTLSIITVPTFQNNIIVILYWHE